MPDNQTPWAPRQPQDAGAQQGWQGQPPQQGQYGPQQQGGQPYQGQQPYQQYGQQPSYAGPSHGYGPPQQPRRKRHLARNILAGFGALIVVIIVITAVSSKSGGHGLTTTGSTSAASTPAATAKASAAAAHKAAPAGIGSAIVLAGNSSGEQMTVTVVTVWRHAEPASQFDDASSGDRLYAVQFRLDDTGSAAYSDSPSNGAVVVDSQGQSYQSSLNNAAECDSFPGTENIAPGSSGLGCIEFEVPQTAKITKVQFTLDSGMGPQTGQWNVALPS
jgi:hypothetical protein